MMQVHEIDTHLENMESAETATMPATANAQAITLNSICTVWAKAKPIILFVRGILFWKHKWQLVIDEVVGVLDTSCAVVNAPE